MDRTLLYSTNNPSKMAYMRELLAGLPLTLLSLADVGLDLQVDEEGATPEENAHLKARSAYDAAHLPSLAIDTGLYLDRFSPERQPGPRVRRICAVGREATDEEMLSHYRQELDRVGGTSEATWESAVALATSGGLVSATFLRRTVFTSRACAAFIPGEPLSALQIDPASGRYYAELSNTERIAVHGLTALAIREFVLAHLHEAHNAAI